MTTKIDFIVESGCQVLQVLSLRQYVKCIIKFFVYWLGGDPVEHKQLSNVYFYDRETKTF